MTKKRERREKPSDEEVITELSKLSTETRQRMGKKVERIFSEELA